MPIIGIYSAGNIHVARGHVNENAGGSRELAVELAGVAAGSALLAELLAREIVVSVIGVALFAELLVDERLNAGHGRRGKRRAPATEEDGIVIGGAGRAALLSVREALGVEAVPNAIGGEQGKIR